MPYIHKDARDDLKYKISYTGRTIQNTGELNYMVTRVINEYLISHGKSYTTLNDIVGVLECAKMELYRRIAAPYEDEKIKQNGDVYTI